MKRFKKMMALMLVLALAMALPVQPLAVLERPEVDTSATSGNAWTMNWHQSVNAGNNTITITETGANHTYTAYQIFAGQMDLRQRFVGGADANHGYPAFTATSTRTVCAYEGDLPATDAQIDENKVKNVLSAPEVEEIHIFRKPVDSQEGQKITETTEWGNYYLISSPNEVVTPGIHYHKGENGTVVRHEVTAPQVEWEQSLQELTWGNGITLEGRVALYQKYVDANYSAAGKETAVVEAEVTAKAVAEALDKLKDEDEIVELASLVSNYLNLTNGKNSNSAGSTATINLNGDAGYYIVVDNMTDGTLHDAYSRYMLRVAGAVTLMPKASIPTVGKKVYENSLYVKNPSAVGDNVTAFPYPGKDLDNSTDTANPGSWNDIADYAIGDDVPFMLIATLPSTLKDYKNGYKLVFHDTFSAGLAYNNNIKVSVVNPSSVDVVDGALYAPVFDETTKELTITIPIAIQKIIANSRRNGTSLHSPAE